ncbi:hypothetical protein N7517_010508 [Penicillium concentricum]|uniref:Uncharacterized protein n=1 Tax=Penicillium concentricum TaxID=293559 RepID=A0A9W9UTE1_9EURO|nr:uncharacterized protein N7517_010508 [Penicillium concentricum]KAJ5355899.1 hypothetical protein N7517_010508 [Penicillium concentricum]
MAICAPGSLYSVDRHYFIQLLLRQIVELQAHPDLRPRVLEGLKELSRLLPGLIEAAHVVGDTVFCEVGCDLRLLFQSSIAALSMDNGDPFSAQVVAEQLLRAFPWHLPAPHLTAPPSWE